MKVIQSVNASREVVTEDSDCFLCRPEDDLVVMQGEYLRVIAGLGPVVQNYFMIASTVHSRSLSDLYMTAPSAIDELTALRLRFSRNLGSLLMTEHGRVPICRDDGDQHEQHCHHAHALFFPTTASIESQAAGFYSEKASFRALAEALSHASHHSSYLLISPTDDEYVVLSGPLNAPRQLTRTLVAMNTGNADRADWRTVPLRHEALENAIRLRNIVGAIS